MKTKITLFIALLICLTSFAQRDSKYYFNKGMFHTKTKEWSIAIKHYKQCLELDNTNTTAWYNLAYCYKQQTHYKGVVRAYKELLKLKPYSNNTLYNLGLAYQQLKEFDKAKETYERLIELFPDSADGYFGLGTVNYDLGNMELALENTLIAHKMYEEKNSRYLKQTTVIIKDLYDKFDNESKLASFKEISQKNNFDIASYK